MIASNAEHTLEFPDELRRRIGIFQDSVDVNAQVEAGLAAVRIPKSIELVTELAAGLPNTPCTALDLVVENLLLNAVKPWLPRRGSALDFRGGGVRSRAVRCESCARSGGRGLGDVPVLRSQAFA